jgi:hypothetical protein
MVVAASPALRTPDVLGLVARLGGITVPHKTLDYWIRSGLAKPSLHRGISSGDQHLWTAADVVGVSWVAWLWAEGDRLPRYARAVARLWADLPAALDQPEPVFFVLAGADAAMVVGEPGLATLVPPPDSRRVVKVWRSISLTEVSREVGWTLLRTPTKQP